MENKRHKPLNHYS